MDLRKVLFAAAITLQPAFVAPILAATPPDYFFGSWTVTKSCAGAHGGVAPGVELQSNLSIAPQGAGDDSPNAAPAKPAVSLEGLKLAYRAGTPMRVPPADFECIPGEEAQSSFLAMSGYAVASEPYYPQEHWYGTATVNGQSEHVLIFPLEKGSPSAILVLLADSGSLRLGDNSVIHLDSGGVIHSKSVGGMQTDVGGVISSRGVQPVQPDTGGLISSHGVHPVQPDVGGVISTNGVRPVQTDVGGVISTNGVHPVQTDVGGVISTK